MMDLKQAMEWADRWRIQGQETEEEEREFPDETVMGILVDEVRRLQSLPAYVNSGVGYKLVPQEPTLEMQMAGAQCGPGAENQGKLMDAWSVYRRMVQASPSISNCGATK